MLLSVTHDQPDVDCIVPDGASVMHSFKAADASTFHEYANLIFVPYIQKEMECTTRLDDVWGRYFKGSTTKKKREYYKIIVIIFI